MRRITRQIYQDIDGIGLDRLGRPTIRGLTYIDEAIKGADQTSSGWRWRRPDHSNNR